MRLEQLQYLVKVVDTKSFTTAGEQLHIAQPSISQSISSLEKELGTILIERSRYGAEPTPTGVEVVEHARRILDDVNSILSITKNTDKAVNSVTIVSTPTINAVILAKCIIDLHKNGVHTVGNEFHILQSVSSAAEKTVRNDEADFAVIPLPQDDPLLSDSSLTFTKLMSADIMAIVRRDNPLAQSKLLTFETIQKYPIALFSNQYVTYNYLYSRISEFGAPNIVFESGNPELTREMARTYENLIGFAYDINVFNHIDSNMAKADTDIVLIPIKDPVTVFIGILAKKNHRLPFIAKELIVQLKQCCSDLQNSMDIYHQKSKI